jgi:uncharacterized Zn-binding protein involved in type VI secretion
MHVCPAVTGVVPHVGGPALPPGAITVLIAGLPALRIGDLLTCVGPPDVVVSGAPTVLIAGKPAARMTDSCAHGGTIVLGCFTVMIGTGGGAASLAPPQIADALAGGAFPGQQSFDNCGVQSAGQIIFLATGQHPSETEILNKAIANGLAAPGGGTGPGGRQALLQEYGVPSDVAPTTRAALGQALRDGKPVIVSADAGRLWNDPQYLGSGHAVTVTGGTFDGAGNLQTVTVNDTGIGQRHVMSADDFFRATDNYAPGSQMNVPRAAMLPR